MRLRFKNDYRKLGQRSDVHTSIRKDLYDEWLELSKSMNQHSTKMFDVLIDDLLKNPDKIAEFKSKVRSYG
jgi:hypothetical protein